MSQYLGLGDGSDGDLLVSGPMTDAPIDSACSGTAGTRTLTVGAALSFAAGQIVYIEQSRGTNVSKWELAKVQSYAGTTLTLESNLDNTYASSGNNKAQVLVVKQYRSITINAAVTAKVWSEAAGVGGVLWYLAQGKISGTGSLYVAGNSAVGQNTTLGTGYIGGAVPGVNPGSSGEGSTGTSVQQTAQNGSGGGGADGNSGGGGGGNGLAGSSGTVSGADTPGQGGALDGVATLVTMGFGGGGGGSWQGGNGAGASGGGKLFMWGNEVNVSGFSSINLNGGVGGNSASRGGGGGGAGGSGFFKGVTVTLGTAIATALGGLGGTGIVTGGTGSVGRFRVEACTISGSTSPAASTVEGGHEFCSTGGDIY